MPHEIDRLCQLPEFDGEPVAISVSGTVKAGRDCGAKSGWRQTNNVVVAQMRDEIVPDLPPFQDFREQEQWSSKLLPKERLSYTPWRGATEFKIIEHIASTLVRKAASRRFSVGRHHDIRQAWHVCCWHFSDVPRQADDVRRGGKSDPADVMIQSAKA